MSRTNQLKCDGCGKKEEEHLAVNWLWFTQVTGKPDSYNTIFRLCVRVANKFGANEIREKYIRESHFCCFECLQNFLGIQIDEMKGTTENMKEE